MSVLLVPVEGALVVLTVLAYAFGARRLLGLHFSLPRIVAAGLVAFLLASPIIRAIGGTTVARSRSLLPGLWFVLLGVVVALLVGMVCLVVAEALVPSGSLPGPVYLARGVRRSWRRGRRYGQIARILVRHRLTPYLGGGRRAELATPEGRARLAGGLRAAMEDGGVTFVKLGQVLSTRRDLLPAEFVEELSRLQDDVPRLSWPQVESVLSAELGAEADEAFASFDRVPLAAASIAQVHAATLASGEPVVVKVCRPGVRAAVEADLDIIARVASRLQRTAGWARGIGSAELASGFAAALREELDLRIEVRNMLAIAAAPGSRDIVVPVPLQALCTERVLVMQRLDGVPLLAAATPAARRGADGASLARVLLSSFLQQIVFDGVFHADPHPGNILVLADGRPGLLDFGSVGRIDAVLRKSLQRLLLAVDRGDPVGLTDALLEVMGRPDQLDELRLERALGRFITRHIGPGIAPGAAMFTDLFRIVSTHGLAVPPEIAAAFRALATLEGGLTQLAPGFDVVAEARAFASGHLADQLHPDALRRSAGDELVALLPLLRRLPRRIDRIASSMEAGTLGVNVRLLADDSDRRVVTGLLHQVLVTVLAATSGIMAVLMLGLRGGPAITARVSLYQFFGYCLLVVAAILALRVLVAVFRPSRD